MKNETIKINSDNNNNININENLYRLVFERLKTAVFIIDESLNIKDANAAALGLSGYGSADVKRLNLNDIFLPLNNGSNFLLKLNNGGNSDADYNSICHALLLKNGGNKVKVDLKLNKLSNNTFSITAFSPDCNIKTDHLSGNGGVKFSLRSAIDALPLWIAFGDIEGVYFFVNKYYNETFKMPEENIIGRNFKEIFPPELYLRHKKLYDQCVNTRESVTFEDKNDFVKEKTAYIYGTYTPIISDDNKVCGVSAATFDITAKKELELQIEKTGRELKETEEKYRALVKNSICGIAISNSDEIIYANDTLLKIFGYNDFNEFSSKKITDYYTPVTLKSINEPNGKNINGKKVMNEFEIDIIRKDKNIRTLLINSAEIKINNKIYTQTAFIDVTERNETNLKLKEWIGRYECITAASGQIAYEYDIITGKITWWASIEKISGYKPGEIEDTIDSWTGLIHPEDRDRAIKNLKETGDNEHAADNEFRVKHKNGHYIWIWNRGFYRHNGSGATAKKLGLMEDITEIKKIEADLISAKEKAEAAGRAKSLFLANISHEMRTPMNGITGFTNLMGASKLSDKQKEYNDIIKASCSHLIDLIDNILDFSKTENINIKKES